MTKLIIIEGPDCAGKSTYIKMIKADLTRKGYKFYSRKATQSTTDADYSKWLQTVEDNPGIMLMDRCWISDKIYSKIKGTKRNVTDNYQKYFNDWAVELGAKQIVLLPLLQIILDRYKQRGDDYINEEELRRVYEQYGYIEPPWSIFTNLTDEVCATK
jgi:thymidylate kinase